MGFSLLTSGSTSISGSALLIRSESLVVGRIGFTHPHSESIGTRLCPVPRGGQNLETGRAASSIVDLSS